MEEAFHTGRYGAGPPGRARPHRTGRGGAAGRAAGRPTAARRYPGGMYRRAQRTADVPDVTAAVPGAEGSAPRRATSRRQLLRGAGAAAALGAVGTVGAGGLAAVRLSQPE